MPSHISTHTDCVNVCVRFFNLLGGVKMNLTLDSLLQKVKSYNIEGIDKIKLAYEYANELHKGQFRQSGEPYIMHPLNVAYILAELHLDTDTICAGILHDTLEDTNTTYEEIKEIFGEEVAILVDGVTKISKLNFSTKQEANLANTRKIITGMCTDIRIIIIKLADRLHNMRTLEFKSEFKQKENSIETMELFVPMAYQLGAYRIKSELEDLSLKYIEPYYYQECLETREKVEEEMKPYISEMLSKIQKILMDRNISNEIKVRVKNIYGIYKRLHLQHHQLSSIHDLLSLKIMVDEIDTCYLLLRPIHEIYHPVNNKFKDFICNPKTNLYQSLHTTVFGPDGRLVQMQIRTFDMDKIASFGLATYWDMNRGKIRNEMQEEFRKKFQVYQSLVGINKAFSNNQEFVEKAKLELFSDKIYVYTTKGEPIELPKGATTVDFAYYLSSDIGNRMVAVYVNDKSVPIDYILRNQDRVRIITDNLSFGYRSDLEEKAHTSYAKQLIKEFNR